MIWHRAAQIILHDHVAFARGGAAAVLAGLEEVYSCGLHEQVALTQHRVRRLVTRDPHPFAATMAALKDVCKRTGARHPVGYAREAWPSNFRQALCMIKGSRCHASGIR